MPTLAIPHNPDGSPMCDAAGKPLEFERKDERRALMSAKKVWWHPKCDPTPEKNQPPEGAQIHIDGALALRFERVPVFDEAGEVVGTRLDWVDLRIRAKAEAEAKALAEMRAKYAPRPALTTLPPEETP